MTRKKKPVADPPVPLSHGLVAIYHRDPEARRRRGVMRRQVDDLVEAHGMNRGEAERMVENYHAKHPAPPVSEGRTA